MLLRLARSHPRATLPLVRARRAVRTWPTITAALDAPDVLGRFAGDAALPSGFGVGMNERVVEYPWVFAMRPSGSVLDAGSSLNHERILTRLLPRVAGLDIVTLAPERRSFTDAGVSYVFADLRDLPYRDARFDLVTCVSTLEHVGMDNSGYGGTADRVSDPAAACARALTELTRVVRPGGRLLITVPYGRPDDLGWMRVFGTDEVMQIACAGADATVTVFAYDAGGWHRSDLDAAAQAVYRQAAAEPHPPDLACTARAVACIELRTAGATDDVTGAAGSA
jgi:SAM-dependent methyltransferase